MLELGPGSLFTNQHFSLNISKTANITSGCQTSGKFDIASLSLSLPGRVLGVTLLVSQSVFQAYLSYELIEDILSCMPVFEFFKSDHY